MAYFNPAPCNQGALADVAALATTVQNPVSPYVLMYSSSNCGGALTGSSFPQYFLPITCDPTIVIPSPSANCLRVITRAQYGTGETLLDPHTINYLPSRISTSSNIFSDPLARLFSYYIPPQYSIIFFKDNPSNHIPKTIAQLEQSSNFLEVDACHGNPILSNGESFWINNDDTPVPPNIGPTNCDIKVAPLNFTHNAPFFVIIEEENFTSVIIDMCTSNRDVIIGASSLNDVWFPQSPGCDSYISNLCSLSNIENTEFAETCACFTQQAALNRQYPNLNVSVCSFGTSSIGDINKSCAFNTKSYKTATMLSNCASFAQCEQSIVNPNHVATNVTCQGNFVDFPIIPLVTITVTPAIISESTSIPIVTWIMLVIAILFLLCFLINLSFV
jgi:hypothetical protein